jgi:hypothetical protein
MTPPELAQFSSVSRRVRNLVNSPIESKAWTLACRSLAVVCCILVWRQGKKRALLASESLRTAAFEPSRRFNFARHRVVVEVPSARFSHQLKDSNKTPESVTALSSHLFRRRRPASNDGQTQAAFIAFRALERCDRCGFALEACPQLGICGRRNVDCDGAIEVPLAGRSVCEEMHVRVY